MIRSLAAALVLSTAIAGPLAAQEAIRSKPTALPVNDATPAPLDAPYPGGTIRLEVDATDTVQRIFHVKETIPVAQAGPMTLLMPQWLPGNHAPRGQIEKLAGLTITADSKSINWVRDPLNVYAFNIDVPQGATSIVAQFQFLSATQPNQGRVVVTAPDFEPRMDLVSNGPPVPGIEVGIRSEDGTVTSHGSDRIGEIVVRGDFVFDGYYRNESATVDAFIDGWYRTGDLGFLHAGELFICGRTKDVIIVHGRNYYSHDIEEIVSTVPGVIPGRAVAIGVDDIASGSEELLLLVETKWPEADVENRKLLRREIKRMVFERLELTPRDVEFVTTGSLVKTTSGKFSRVENLKRYQAMRDGGAQPGDLK